MHLNQIHHFLDVARTHSMSQSAADLFISPQGLSRSIASLEKECNLTLFSRTNHGVELTREGREFETHARAFWTAYCEFERAVTHMGESPEQQGNVTVDFQAAPLVTVGDLLPALLQRIAEVMPEAQVDVSERDSFEMVEYAHGLTLQQTENLLMVTPVPSYRLESYLPDNRFHITKLRDMPMVARVAKTHPLAQRKWVTRAELAQEKIVCFSEPVLEEMIHHLLDPYGGPQFSFKGSIRNLVGRFPDAVCIAGQYANEPMGDSVVSVPIQDTVSVCMVAVTANPMPRHMRELLSCVAGVVNNS